MIILLVQGHPLKQIQALAAAPSLTGDVETACLTVYLRGERKRRSVR